MDKQSGTLEMQVGRVNSSQVAEALQAKAAQDSAFKAVFYKFGLRERSRNQVTVRSLALSMQKDGYNFPTAKYQEILQFLSSIGIGKLAADKKDNIRALVDIKITLQSIGKAALEASSLKPFKQANRYTRLTPLAETAPTSETNKTYQTELKITIDGNVVTYPGVSVTPDQLGNFLINFSRLTKKVKS